MDDLQRACAVKTLAATEKHLKLWAEILQAARENGDEVGQIVALNVCDPLLDLRCVLTEHLETAQVAA